MKHARRDQGMVLSALIAVVVVLGVLVGSWAAGPGVSAASSCHSHHGHCPTPTPSSTSPRPTSTTPTQPSSSTSSTGGIPFNHCTNPTYTIVGSASNPQNGVTINGYYVDADTWNFGPYPGSQETLYACNLDNWYAMVNVNDNANDGAVKSYPDVHRDYTSPAVSSFSDITSVFAHTAPSYGAWDYAYDIWLNNYGYELMIWTQSNGRQAHVPGVPIVGNVTIDGRAYTIHHSSGSSYIAYDMPTTTTSGNLDLLHIIRDAISRGLLPNSATLTAIDYGVEVCDTGSLNTRFEVNNFSITTS